MDIAPQLLPDGGAHGLLPILDRWDDAWTELTAFLATEPRSSTAVAEAPRFLAPILHPRKVICIGDNYADHNAQLGKPGSGEPDKRPTFFLKPPTTSVVGSGGSIPYPGQVDNLDWEIELAVVIGRTTRDIATDDAQVAIAGYTIGIDLSARDWQFDPRNALNIDVFGGKAFDASCPLGPWIVPASFVADPQALDLTLKVNGVVKQSSNTRQMIRSVREQVAAISRVLTLEPGDVILTGTPSGTGISTGTFLAPGDRLEAIVEGIGTLRVDLET